MKLFSTTIFAFFLIGMTSCQSETENFDDTPSVTADTTNITAPVNPAAVTPLPALPSPGLALPQPASGLPNQVGQRPLTNPEHGKPYHDCALQVGAPLGAGTAPAQTATPGFTPTLPNLQTPPSGVKLNPAHGKPGHRCEIAVGAPLS